MDECGVCGLPSEDGFDHDDCVDPEWVKEPSDGTDTGMPARR